MEKFLTKIANTQAFQPNDELSAIIEKYASDELEEESLDLVCAAEKTNYQEFLKRIGKADI